MGRTALGHHHTASEIILQSHSDKYSPERNTKIKMYTNRGDGPETNPPSNFRLVFDKKYQIRKKKTTSSINDVRGCRYSHSEG